MPSLADLPRNVRDNIWSLLFSSSPEVIPQLLSVSQQLYEEVLPYMFRRPVTFDSQHDLYSWLGQVGTDHLQNVDTLSLCLRICTDSVEPRPDDNFNAGDLNGDDELSLLKQALTQLPAITSFTIYKDVASESFEYWSLYNGVITAVSDLWPMLKSFAAHTDKHKLDFLRHLPALERLQFTGFADSSPMETRAILSHLRHLKHIDIMPALRSPRSQGSPQRDSGLKPCLTREVLRSLRLEGMRINESQTSNPSAPEFWRPSLITALSSLSRHSLTRFELALEDFNPDIECTNLFCTFLKQSYVQDLVVEWKDIADSADDVLHAVPNTLSTLRLGSFSDATASLALLDRISQLREEKQLQRLSELVIVCDDSISHAPDENANLQQAMAALGQMGIKVDCL